MPSVAGSGMLAVLPGEILNRETPTLVADT
jgi:hypothetical protein